ncbi:uncharacterized protein LOC9646664 [Selaginella moellendorffii]|uniref:uncharacterized protein LOC9646664 n=1 Tax=Selaginella moellendorffii TaxID=88036 RepID=UPI000D1CCC13|nr:uncharacterized protein LOC9646664 [Selaginella moellendorffii]|eukprot:XP_024530937.1 uncharacterized protein LOC9646664 [Selaginella moellendorffii]
MGVLSLPCIACVASRSQGTALAPHNRVAGCRKERRGALTVVASSPGSDGRSARREISAREGYFRLFSNVNEATLKHEPGSLVSAIFLVAGTTIGAGVLAIPAVTEESGFAASSLTCSICWLYMVATGLLVAEVNVSTMCELGSGGVSIVSMAERTLGAIGVRFASLAYLFIHYALLVAYVARSADIISNASGAPLWASALLFTGIFGGLCYSGSQRIIGAFNGALVLGIIASFISLVAVSTGYIEPELLLRANFAAVPRSVPVIALAFVYQNVVPVICTNLEGDLKKIRTAIVAGTAIPLAMFIVWDAVILGSVYPGAGNSSLSDPLMQLRSQSGIISPLVEVFSLLAITTSYIGFVLGLSDFVADLLKLPGGGSRKPLPYAVTLLPPTALALLSPDIFFKALDFAGAYGVLVLFGILPASMAWSQRYSTSSLPAVPPMVPGGRLALGVMITGAGFIITTQFLSTLS